MLLLAGSWGIRAGGMQPDHEGRRRRPARPLAQEAAPRYHGSSGRTSVGVRSGRRAHAT